jgi:predicted DNA-binding transcriptional regulator AlpA
MTRPREEEPSSFIRLCMDLAKIGAEAERERLAAIGASQPPVDDLFAARALESSALADKVAAQVLAGWADTRGTAPAIIDIEEAAHLLGISSEALFKRVQRHQVPGVVRTGRRVQFVREKMLETVQRRARR